MSETLHVWMDGAHIGEFHRRSKGARIGFSYDDGDRMPISLSLPLDGHCARNAPSAFLENLLPDDEGARRRMALRLHSEDTDTFSLLGMADTVGGLVFTKTPELPDAPIDVTPLDDAEIIAQIGYARANGYSWFARDEDDEFYERNRPRCRFSIAGGQPKITLARRDGVWLWPNYAVPSTHIIKPEVSDCPDSDYVEDATMTLGRMCGLDVADHGILEVDDGMGGSARAFITRRFDRVVRGGGVHRIHCEDLTQAMGMPPSSKYDIDAVSCVRFLHHHDPSDGMGYEWVRRMAFNAASGDCDSHGKNYSIMLRPDGFSFAPMYDMTATRTWVHLDQELAMPIAGAQYPERLSPKEWAAFAEECGLDPDRVVHIARSMSGAVLGHLDEACATVPGRTRGDMAKAVRKANESAEPENAAEAPAPRTAPVSGFGSGMVWVSPHERNGHPVIGYYRSYPSR